MDTDMSMSATTLRAAINAHNLSQPAIATVYLQAHGFTTAVAERLVMMRAIFQAQAYPNPWQDIGPTPTPAPPA